MCLSLILPTKPPEYDVSQISAGELQQKLASKGIQVPLGMLDSVYYYTDRVGWANILAHATISGFLYKENKFDCENFAFKAFTSIAENYGLNSFAVALGYMPQGYHGFNLFYCGGEDFMLFEPNAGFMYLAPYFEMGENGYIPDRAVL